MRKLATMLLCLLLAASQLWAQTTKTITGKVTDDKGAAIASASVSIVGSHASTITNAIGEFKISAKVGDEVIITAISFTNGKFKVGDKSSYNVALVSSASVMDEVMVTAVGTKTRKKEQGYNATNLKAAELTTAKPTNIASGLVGKVAGFEISATNGGVNPNYRLILRGARSFTGNNQALIVIDNVIVPSTLLGNLNPDDIADITILNGGSAAALYGTEGANGVMVITTKKGSRGVNTVKISNTTTIEQVAYFPQHQTKFGGGGSSYGVDANGNPFFSPRENQSYGPAYDGTVRNLGDPLEDGSQFTTTYAPKDDWKKFWNTGITNQTDFSISSGDQISTFYFSAQNVNTTGTTPHDVYNRVALTLAGTRKVTDKIDASYTLGYIQNRYDVVNSGTFATMYDNLNNTPANVPLTQFKDWRNNKFANPNGYYNPWYQNPYFSIDDNRNKTKNDYFRGSFDIKYTPLKWLDFTLRSGITTQSQTAKYYQEKFTYTPYALNSNGAIGGQKSNVLGNDEEYSYYTARFNSDFQIAAHKKVKNFTFNGMIGASLNQITTTAEDAYVSSLIIPNLYSLSNSVNNPVASNSSNISRKIGVYAEYKMGFKDYLFLRVTGRQDWVSYLNPGQYGFFYPGADLSFVVTDAIKGLRQVKWLDYLKLRTGLTGTGNVNYPTNSMILPTYGQANGYPFNGVGGYTVGGTLVDPNLTSEYTKGQEVGADFSLFKKMVDASVTWYHTRSDHQTLPVSISRATGFSSYYFNTGALLNTGVEARLAVNLITKKDLSVAVGGNYTYSDNSVESINSLLPQLGIATYSNAGSYAVAGHVFPVIMGNDYVRDPQGRVIVDAVTGRPTAGNALQILGNGATRNRLSLDLTVRFKQFHLYTLFEYRGGNKIYNVMGTSLDWSGDGIRTVAYDRKAFVFPNSSYADPSHPGSYIANTSVVVNDANDGFWADNDGTYNRGVASNYVTSGAFWKLRQLSISYDLPSSIVNKTKVVKAATFSVQGRNLFIWLPKSNLYTDPEYSDAGNDSNGIGLTGMSTSPPSRYYGFSLSLTF
jgi:TonB-linked SusC/RagA family outer membrane protein